MRSESEKNNTLQKDNSTEEKNKQIEDCAYDFRRFIGFLCRVFGGTSDFFTFWLCVIIKWFQEGLEF